MNLMFTGLCLGIFLAWWNFEAYKKLEVKEVIFNVTSILLATLYGQWSMYMAIKEVLGK